MEQIDIAIIGAGVLGLSVASSVTNNRRKVFVLEKNSSFGQETSSRNSEVIHSGIYYPFNSLKHRLCIEGKRMLYELCPQQGIRYNKTGKLIVATKIEEIPALEQLFNNGIKNEVENLRIIDKKEIKELEPNINAIQAIFSPETGIVDSHGLMKHLLSQAKAKGGEIVYEVEVIALDKNKEGYKVSVKDTSGEDFSFISKCVINCAGLNSDQVAFLAGIDLKKAGYQLQYSKGQYFRLYNSKSWKIRHLIYPLPDLKNKSLGIHLTPDLNNDIRLGPDAHNIGKKIDYNIDEQAKAGFYNSIKQFLSLVKTDDLYPDTAGIRPKLYAQGDAVRDFIIQEESSKNLANFINLIGIESPGLTAALAIGEIVKNIVKNIF